MPPPPVPAVLCLPDHRSVVPLGPGARWLGLDPDTALAVDDLPPPLAEMLDGLDGPVERAEFVAMAVGHGVAADDAEELLHDLAAAGVLVDATGSRWRAVHRRESTVVVAGAGPLAVGVVVGLVQAGVGTVYTETSGTVVAADVGTGYVDADRGHPRRSATAAAVRRLRPGAATGPAPMRLAPDLVVLADALAVDPARITELHVGGTAHLPARLRDGVGLVGPLVLPGRTTCLRCLDLHRCALHTEWRTVVAQLVDRCGRADPACAAATAALATAQAVAALDATSGGATAPPTLEATLELDTTAGTVVRRTWTPRPECGCGAASAHRGMRHGRATCADARGQETIEA